MISENESVAFRINQLAGAVKQRVPKDGRLYERLRSIRDLLPREVPQTDHPFSKVLLEFGRSYRDVTFVQVGANDGVGRDPLHDEIRRGGWTGIMVEPVPYVFERLEQNCADLPGVKLMNVAIAAEAGSRPLYYLPESDDPDLFVWYDALASFDEAVLKKHVNLIPDIEQRIRSMDVACLTFDALCKEAGFSKIDVVQIDTEGYDWEVIKLIDLDAYDPAVIMFEHVHLSDADRAACYAHLRAAGFAIYVDVMDALCLRASHRRPTRRRIGRLWKAILADERVSVP